MAGLLSSIRRLNNVAGTEVVEPFAGGAGASLSLLYREETPAITINDADPSVFAFWWSITHRLPQFLDRLSKSRATMAEWRRQRDTYRSAHCGRLDLGFAAFFLNRCNRSGIIMNGGPIGGIRQTGAWGIDARFNKKDLAKRCARVGEYRDRISTENLDGIDMILRSDPEQAFLFMDPPYYTKGPTLYLNALDDAYHKRLAKVLRTRQESAWVLTYDDCTEIRQLYASWATIRPFSLRYVTNERRVGQEVMIVPRWMRLPRSQGSAAIGW